MRTGPRFLALIILAVSCFTGVDAWSQERVWRIGILWHAANLEQEAAFFKPFADQLRHLGYVEGRNVVFDHTFVDENYDRFDARAAELVAHKADIILASVAAAAAAARKASRTTPVVFASSGDPVKMGIVESLARPGGNATGLTLFYPELSAKYPDLLKEIVPSMSRVAVLCNPANFDHTIGLAEVERSAQALKIEVLPFRAKSPEEFVEAFASMKKADVGGLIVLGDAMFRIQRKLLVAFAASNRIPAIYGPRDFAVDGGLVTFGVRIADNFRRSAELVDRILKGTSPASIPVERPSKLELVVNLKAAKALGLRIPESVLLRADEVLQE